MMTMFEDHILTIIIALPLLGAAVLSMMPDRDAVNIRRTAFGVSLLVFAVSIYACMAFLDQRANTAGDQRFLLSETYNWIAGSGTGEAALQIQYAVALDGISLPLLMLTAFLTPLAILASFNSIRDRAKLYYILLLLLHSSMLGVFCARDLLLFYVFFEFTLIPLYFLIAIWGGRERRVAANTFFIYTLAGSMLTFAGVLYFGWLAYANGAEGHRVFSFNMDRLTELAATGVLTGRTQFWLFLALFAGLAIKVPLFPFHTWLPLAHTEAPTAGSAILAGVLLKLGTYGFLRISLPMLPDASIALAPLMGTLAVAGIIYGALAAWVQKDIKKLVAYSSVSHLGYCLLGLFCVNMSGLSGSLLYMVNHGLSTAALFFIIGMIYERYHTREISQLGGLARKMPWMTFFLIFFSLSSIGLPGLNGFVSEFLVLLGTFTSGHSVGNSSGGPLGIRYAALAATGIILGAVYLLHMCRCVLFGPLKEPEHGFDHECGLPQDLSITERAVLSPIAALCLVLGLYPAPLLDIMQPELQVQTMTALTDAVQRHDVAKGHLFEVLDPEFNASTVQSSRSDKVIELPSIGPAPRPMKVALAGSAEPMIQLSLEGEAAE